ncbi:MAG: hybrid sensor histidine kinase/response regulator, partial [Okeania sp. SIO3B3]|nr:hybrid sensor histidine kinase/response regulator [Okeania sp. SIO3B3]
LERFAQLAAIAIDNAQLYTSAQREIDQRKAAQEELEFARDAAETANRAKSIFLANMSHELRTPLNAIIGYSEMLTEDLADFNATELKPDVDKIFNAGRHLLSLINDILDLSKIEAGKMELYLEMFNIELTLKDICQTIQPLIAKNGNVLTADFAPDLGNMYADLTKVRQTVLNLLSNASKFTEQGVLVFIQDILESCSHFS